jgi:P27 family predicted phage terminase small subunit
LKLTIPPPIPESLNEFGRKHWESQSLEMVKIGLLTTSDVDQFAAYCNEMGAYWEAERNRKECMENKKYSEVNRWFNFAQKHLKSARDLAIQFGLTPASRSRINVPKEEKRSKLDEI